MDEDGWRVQVSIWAGKKLYLEVRLMSYDTHVVVDDVGILDRFVLVLAAESLSLHTSNVENVGLADDLVEAGRFVEVCASASELVLDALRHRKGWWGDEVERDRVERQELDEGMDSASKLEVTDQSDGETVDGTEFCAKSYVCQ